MSSIQEDLFPDSRLVIQTAVFLVTLFFANMYIIKPALRLTNERKRRTTGAADLAKSEISRAESLEASYETTFKARLEEIKSLRLAEISAGHKEAEKVFTQAQQKWDAHLAGVKSELTTSIVEERKKVSATVTDVVASLMQRLGASAIVVTLLSLFAQTSANAAEHEAVPLDTMTGIVWPYVQFAVYFFAIIYFGNKVVHGILESRREALRVRLTEAKQALTDAQRKAAEFEAKMKSMGAELEEMRKQYLQDGTKEREKIIAEAHQLAAQMAHDAERTARELVARGKEELRREIVEQALSSLESKITPDVAKNLNKKLNEEAMAGIGKLAVH